MAYEKQTWSSNQLVTAEKLNHIEDGIVDVSQNASQSTAGLMSADDKKKLDGIATGAQVNSITGVKGNSESSYRTGNVNITAANIGLGNVENKSSATIRGELTKANVTTALGYTPPTTDTNTWRGIQDNLTSSSTSDSLSANQGRLLKNEINNCIKNTDYNPETKTSDMTKVVGKDANGKLWTVPVEQTEIVSATESWLNTHVSPSTGYVIDDTLSIQGAAADAAKVGELKSVLNDGILNLSILEAIEPIVYTNQFVKKNGEIVSANNYNCLEYTVEPNSIYNVSGFYGWDVAACVWFDDGGNVIEASIYKPGVYIQEASWFDNVLISPVNAKKVRINSRSNDVGKSGVQKIFFNKADFMLYDINPTWIYDKIWESGSAREADLAGSKYCKISVNPGDVYVIESTSNYYARAWAFYDANGIMISRQQTEAAYISEIVVVPNNAVTLAINAFSSDETRNIRNYCHIQKLTVNNNYYTYRKFKNLKWVALGDSITDINSLKTPNGLYYMPNYVNFVSEELGITAINKGIGGTGYLSNNSGQSTTFAERALTIDTDVDITTVFGTLNDIYLDNLQIGTEDDAVGASTVCGQVKQTIENLYTVNPEMLIIIVTPCPFPRGNGINKTDTLYQVTQEYVKALIDIANMYSLPVLDLFHESGLRPWDNNFKTQHYLNGDGQHLNSEAHRRYIAPKFADIIRKCCDIG